MKLRLKWMKSLILIALIISSIYQASRLWFDDISNRNFFYSFFEEVPAYETVTNDEALFIVPEAIYIHFDDDEKEFTSIKPTNPQFSSIMDSSISIFQMLHRKGVSLEQAPSLLEILNSSSIILNYPFNMDSQVFLSDLKIDFSDLSNKIDQFNQVIITPAEDNENNINIYFYSQYNDNIVGYQLEKSLVASTNERLNKSIHQLQENNLPVYISTLKDGFKLFKYNTLIPLPSNNLTYVNNIYFKTPFMEEDTLNKSAFNHYISQFFENPELKVEAESDKKNETIYGDGRIILKYNFDGVIEYFNGKVDKGQKQSLLQSFYTAEKFLKNDILLAKQEYYLDHIETSEDETVFYYSYRVNGYKLLISSHIREEYEIVYPMVVKVTNSTVSYYKRLILEKEDYIEQMLGFKSNYVTALDNFYRNKDASQVLIENMYLSYYITDLNLADFTWAVETDNMTYVMRLD